MLRAVTGPFDRTAKTLGGLQHQRIFAISQSLRPKSAADIGRDDTHLRLWNAKDFLRQPPANAMYALRSGSQHIAIFIGFPFANGRAGFQIIGDKAVVIEGNGGDMFGFGKGAFGFGAIAISFDIGKICLGFRPDQGSAAVKRLSRHRDCLAAVVIDLDQFRRILRLRDGVSNNECDGIADMAHMLLAQDRNVPMRIN